MGLKVAITGEIRSGKDTVAEYIQLEYGKNMRKLYFAQGIENIIRTYFPESFEGTTKPRKHYQDIGQFMRTINIDVWVNDVATHYKRMKNVLGVEDFICTDLRQRNEYDWLKSEGFTIIKVETEPEIRIERMKASGDKFNAQDLIHPVEMTIRSLPYDYLITNNTSLEDLFAQVDDVVSELKGGE